MTERGAVERVNDDGQRQEIDPALLAQYDQMEAHFQELTAEFLSIRSLMQEAARHEQHAVIPELTKRMEALVHTEWPDADEKQINYIMFLIHLLEQAQNWTSHNFQTVELLMQLLSALAPPDHAIRALPGFDHEESERKLQAAHTAVERLERAEEAVGNTFTTDTGITLHHVHDAGNCEGPFCVVHKPAPGPWSSWDVHWREDWRLMVRICPHDVHHVAIEEMLRMPLLGLIAHDHPEGCDCACDFTRCVTVTDSQGAITGFRVN